MEHIVVDTSSILFGLSKKLDVFQSVEEQLGYMPVISKGVIHELEVISKKGGRYKKYAAVASSLIERHAPVIENDSEFVDNWILSSAPKYGYACTNDMKLKVALRRKGVVVYSLSIGGTLK